MSYYDPRLLGEPLDEIIPSEIITYVKSSRDIEIPVVKNPDNVINRSLGKINLQRFCWLYEAKFRTGGYEDTIAYKFNLTGWTRIILGGEFTTQIVEVELFLGRWIKVHINCRYTPNGLSIGYLDCTQSDSLPQIYAGISNGNVIIEFDSDIHADSVSISSMRVYGNSDANVNSIVIANVSDRSLPNSGLIPVRFNGKTLNGDFLETGIIKESNFNNDPVIDFNYSQVVLAAEGDKLKLIQGINLISATCRCMMLKARVIATSSTSCYIYENGYSDMGGGQQYQEYEGTELRVNQFFGNITILDAQSTDNSSVNFHWDECDSRRHGSLITIIANTGIQNLFFNESDASETAQINLSVNYKCKVEFRLTLPNDKQYCIPTDISVTPLY